MISRRLALGAALGLLLAGSPPRAAATQPDPSTLDPEAPLSTHEFRRVSIGLTGGFQVWSLSALETTLDQRAQYYSADGFELGSPDFGPTYSFGLETQVRIGKRWYARGQADWTSLSTNERDLDALPRLGATVNTSVSMSLTTQVRSHPFIFGLGGGRAFDLEAVRFGFSGSLVVAPVQVRDEILVRIDVDTKTEVISQGTGLGFELGGSVDYYTDTRTTLFLEAFFRYGATDVELQESGLETSILPRKRRVDFGGGGIRLGLRFI